ncbi:UDP-glucose 6-dehydrogenase 3 [Acorus calamus]|uniref:UDP-glucose 6-dehydrogenase 3 n=1 Tax=Acorus calamus TaxID=4465 RepID=A0AAV9E8S2_ACOCL|nr:UDP-glucose 6-dehydrogenase 3 [Acorus calamus]
MLKIVKLDGDGGDRGGGDSGVEGILDFMLASVEERDSHMSRPLYHPLQSSKPGLMTSSPSLNPDSTTLSAPTMLVNIHFSSGVEYHVVDSDIIFVNTPTKIHNLGAGKAAYLTYIVVKKSIVPVKIAETIEKIQP